MSVIRSVKDSEVWRIIVRSFAIHSELTVEIYHPYSGGSGDCHRPGELIVEYEQPDGKVGMKRGDVIEHISNRLSTMIRAHPIEKGKLLNHRFRF